MREAILALIGERALVVFTPELRAIAGSASPLAPAAVRAWGALPQGVGTEDATRLSKDASPAVRAAILDAAPGSLTDAQVASRLDDDPDPEVRAVAVRVWVERHGVAAYPRIAPLLADPNQPEGAAAARALGALGEPVVADLYETARESGIDGARGPMLALSLAGSSGALALRALRLEHADPTVRAFASFLLGRSPTDH